MFATERVALGEALELRGQAGELLPDDAFFTMTATAPNGSTWTSERFTISENVHAAVDGSDVQASLPFIASSSPPFVGGKSNSLELVVHTSAIIPCNAVEERNGSSSMTKLNLESPDGSRVTIFQRKGYLLLIAHNDVKEVDIVAASRLLEGLAIASGTQMTISSQISRGESLETTRIFSVPLAHLGKTIWPPFDSRQYRSHVAFVAAYAKVAHAGSCPFYDCWLSILAAWDQGLVASSLPLGVGVERMLRELFSNRMQEEPAVQAAADAMAQHLVSAPVDEQMKKRGRGALSSIKGKSPSAALKALAAEGWFRLELEAAWRAVRNRSTHGGSIIAGETTAEIQAGLDSMLRCLHLFYLLLLIHIKFSHPFLDHSTRGFPAMSLPATLTVSTHDSPPQKESAPPEI